MELIEQKFKLGQEVYFLQTDNMGFSGNKRYSVASFIIEKIEISEREKKLLYHGRFNSYTYSFLEDKLYLEKKSVIRLVIVEYKKRMDEYSNIIKDLEEELELKYGLLD